jgi:hypothetical protein
MSPEHPLNRRNWTDEDIYQEISNIVSKFTNLQCDKCAREVIKWLKENGISGKILRLTTANPKERYILSERQGGNESITENGKHYGVEVRGRVFDNLSSYGLPREDWIKDFQCPSQKFIITELADL